MEQVNIFDIDLKKYAMGCRGETNVQLKTIAFYLDIELKYMKWLMGDYLPEIELLVNGNLVFRQNLYVLSMFSDFNQRYDGKYNFEDGYLKTGFFDFSKKSRTKKIDIYYPLYPSGLNLLTDADIKVVINNSCKPAIDAYTNKAELKIFRIS